MNKNVETGERKNLSKEKCEKVMESFFMLDKGERLSFSCSCHLLKCRDCRSQVRYMTKAEKLMSKPLKQKTPLERKQSPSVFEKINSYGENKFKPVPLFNWIFIGIVLVAIFAATGFFLKDNSIYEISLWSFYFVFAAFISIYCAFFIWVNLDFFIKKIDTKNFIK